MSELRCGLLALVDDGKRALRAIVIVKVTKVKNLYEVNISYSRLGF